MTFMENILIEEPSPRLVNIFKADFEGILPTYLFMAKGQEYRRY